MEAMIRLFERIVSCFACKSDCNNNCESKCLVGPKKWLFKSFSSKKLNDWLPSPNCSRMENLR